MKSIKFLSTLILLLGFSLLHQSCEIPQTIQLAGPSKSIDAKVAGAAEVEEIYKRIEAGGTIKLKEMTYHLDRPLRIINKTNLTLDGSDCTFIMNNKSEDVVYVEGSKNITLKNFKATHIEPDGPIGCTGSVIQIYSNEDVLIEQCELNGSGIIGVVAYETKNLKVANNYIYNNSQYGVLYNETSLEITGNTFEDNGMGGNSHVAKALDGGLSQIQPIAKGTNADGLTMSNNIYK